MIPPGMAAALALAAAVLVAPAPPRRRLSPVARWSRSGRIAAPAIGVIAVVVGVGAAVLVSPAVAIAAGIGVAVLTAGHRRRGRARRRRAEGDALAAALEVLVGELGVGAHPVQAFDTAAREAVGAAGRALRAVAGRARLGADVAAVLRASAEGSAVPVYWERMAICWQLAAEQGLAMVTLMRAAQRDIVDRQRFAASVESGSAGARATAGILAGLPLLGVLLGQLVGARPLPFLLGGGVGGWLLVTGVTLIGLGVTWSDRIIDRAMR